MTIRIEQCPACRSADLQVARTSVWDACDLVACATCRTEFQSPQPTDARLAEIYGSGYYTPWSYESADAVDSMKRATFEPMLVACQPGPGRTVLDLGCATGSFLAEATSTRCDHLRHRSEPRGDRPPRTRAGREAPHRSRRRRPVAGGEVRRGGDDRLHRARAGSRRRALRGSGHHPTGLATRHLDSAGRLAHALDRAEALAAVSRRASHIPLRVPVWASLLRRPPASRSSRFPPRARRSRWRTRTDRPLRIRCPCCLRRHRSRIEPCRPSVIGPSGSGWER